jgi:hypothetical protein
VCNFDDDVQSYTLIYFGGIVMNAPHATENLTIHHKVQDYSKWRAVYDAHETSRRTAGITNGSVFRNAENPNDVVVLQDVSDVTKARTWAASEDLKTAMQKGGVIGSPNVRFSV